MTRIAIAGVGNCASTLVQALQVARSGESSFVSLVPGLAEFSIADIRVVAAFDVNETKVGQDLADAIVAAPNCTTVYVQPEHGETIVSAGPLADGLDGPLAKVIRVAPAVHSASVESVADVLTEAGAEILLIYLPVGAQRAAELYAEAALRSGCALVNCTPASLATSPHWSDRFREHGLPILGDDMKSWLGSTTIHTTLLELMAERGIQVDSTYQLNIGGNTDFLNMSDPVRAAAKRKTKAAALRRVVDVDASFGVGPSEFVPHLQDHKVGYIRIEGHGLLGAPVSIDVQLRVEDSPNAAPVALDAIRVAAGLRAGVGLNEALACQSLFKHPKSN